MDDASDRAMLFTNEEYGMMESPASSAIETPRYSGVTPFHVPQYNFELAESNADKVEAIRRQFREILGPMTIETLNHYTVDQGFAYKLERAFEELGAVRQCEFLYKALVAVKRMTRVDVAFRNVIEFINFVLRRDDYRVMNVVLKDNKIDVECYERVDIVEKQICKRQWRVEFKEKYGREPSLAEELSRDRDLNARALCDAVMDYEGGPSILQL